MRYSKHLPNRPTKSVLMSNFSSVTIYVGIFLEMNLMRFHGVALLYFRAIVKNLLLVTIFACLPLQVKPGFGCIQKIQCRVTKEVKCGFSDVSFIYLFESRATRSVAVAAVR